MRFAPPLGEPLSWQVTMRRLGRDGSLIGFSSVYRLQWSRLGRGYRLDATLLRIESDARPELVQALTAVLQPLIGQRDRKSVVSGKCVSVRVDSGGRRIIKKKK